MRWYRYILSLVLAALMVSPIGVLQVSAATSNISTLDADSHAWNDVIGWIDFNDSTNGAVVTDSELQQWAVIVSTGTYIALDCATQPSPIGNNCSAQGGYDWGVENDGNGVLSGYAWSDEYGWISFSGANYGVTIDSEGTFSGYAWNTALGWISFNCADDTACSYPYKVDGTWQAPTGGVLPAEYLESSSLDTGATDGFVINSIYWEGNIPANTTLGFQLAVSNSATSGFSGSDFKGTLGAAAATENVLYTASDADADGVGSIPVDGASHHPFESGYRYYRYRVYFDKNGEATGPTVSKIIINWSK